MHFIGSHLPPPDFSLCPILYLHFHNYSGRKVGSCLLHFIAKKARVLSDSSMSPGLLNGRLLGHLVPVPELLPRDTPEHEKSQLLLQWVPYIWSFKLWTFKDANVRLHVQLRKLVHMSDVHCHVCASSASSCTFVYWVGQNVHSFFSVRWL